MISRVSALCSAGSEPNSNPKIWYDWRDWCTGFRRAGLLAKTDDDVGGRRGENTLHIRPIPLHRIADAHGLPHPFGPFDGGLLSMGRTARPRSCIRGVAFE